MWKREKETFEIFFFTLSDFRSLNLLKYPDNLYGRYQLGSKGCGGVVKYGGLVIDFSVWIRISQAEPKADIEDQVEKKSFIPINLKKVQIALHKLFKEPLLYLKRQVT